MQPAFDQTSIRMTLRKAIQNGRFTLEALDHASPGFHLNTRVHPQSFRNGYQGIEHRNLLRDDPTPVEAVQATPDPKDFAEVLAPAFTPIEAEEKLPITLETNGYCPF